MCAATPTSPGLVSFLTSLFSSSFKEKTEESSLFFKKLFEKQLSHDVIRIIMGYLTREDEISLMVAFYRNNELMKLIIMHEIHPSIGILKYFNVQLSNYECQREDLAQKLREVILVAPLKNMRFIVINCCVNNLSVLLENILKHISGSKIKTKLSVGSSLDSLSGYHEIISENQSSLLYEMVNQTPSAQIESSHPSKDIFDDDEIISLYFMLKCHLKNPLKPVNTVFFFKSIPEKPLEQPMVTLALLIEGECVTGLAKSIKKISELPDTKIMKKIIELNSLCFAQQLPSRCWVDPGYLLNNILMLPSQYDPQTIIEKFSSLFNYPTIDEKHLQFSSSNNGNFNTISIIDNSLYLLSKTSPENSQTPCDMSYFTSATNLLLQMSLFTKHNSHISTLTIFLLDSIIALNGGRDPPALLLRTMVKDHANKEQNWPLLFIYFMRTKDMSIRNFQPVSLPRKQDQALCSIIMAMFGDQLKDQTIDKCIYFFLTQIVAAPNCIKSLNKLKRDEDFIRTFNLDIRLRHDPNLVISGLIEQGSDFNKYGISLLNVPNEIFEKFSEQSLIQLSSRIDPYLMFKKSMKDKIGFKFVFERLIPLFHGHGKTLLEIVGRRPLENLLTAYSNPPSGTHKNLLQKSTKITGFLSYDDIIKRSEIYSIEYYLIKLDGEVLSKLKDLERPFDKSTVNWILNRVYMAHIIKSFVILSLNVTIIYIIYLVIKILFWRRCSFLISK